MRDRLNTMQLAVRGDVESATDLFGGEETEVEGSTKRARRELRRGAMRRAYD